MPELCIIFRIGDTMCKCWTQWLLIAVIFMFFLMTLLAGCGIKGPIYLPDEKQKKADKNSQTQQNSRVSSTYSTPIPSTQNSKD